MSEMRKYFVDGGGLGFYGLEKETDGLKRASMAGKLLTNLTFIFPIAGVYLHSSCFVD